MRHVFGQRWYTTVWHTSLSALISFAAEGRIQNHSEKVEWHTCIYIYIYISLCFHIYTKYTCRMYSRTQSRENLHS